MTERASVRVLLADDHPIVRRGLRLLLEDEPGFEVVAEVANGAEAVEHVLSIDVDLAVLDISMPRMTGLQAAATIVQHRPNIRVLILSMHDNESLLFQALRAGAAGYVLKSAVDTDLLEACRATMRGEPFVYPAGLRSLIERYRELARDGAIAPDDPLTSRETEIVKLIAEGMSGKAISDSLSISEKTVERHRSNVYAKLGVSDRVQLTRYAIRRGLIAP